MFASSSSPYLPCPYLLDYLIQGPRRDDSKDSPINAIPEVELTTDPKQIK